MEPQDKHQENQDSRGESLGRTMARSSHPKQGQGRSGSRGGSNRRQHQHHCCKRTFVYRGTRRHRLLQKRQNDVGMLPSASHAHEHAPHNTISIMSYNVLADAYAKKHSRELYSSVPWTCLRWHTRASLLAKEIVHWSPTVVCMQEVDKFEHLESLLKHHGYVGRYLQRTNDRPDGLALFWKSRYFSLVHAEDVIFAGHGMRDNVAQVYKLQYLGNLQHSDPFELVVSNIHVLFNPKRGDIKLGQVRVLMDTISTASRDGMVPVVMCGDYNSAPYSSLYDYLSSGYLNVLESDRKRVSGQIAGSSRSQERRPQSTPTPWKLEEIIMAVGSEDNILRHSLELESSYKFVLGEEPGFTTAHDKYVGTVDYIFYSNGNKGNWRLEPNRVLRPPPERAIIPRGLPGGFWPSDHISLLTSFNMVHIQEDVDHM
jgi:mRNA deadenylase 3'-5' endonuclease subunit Ccr4